MSVARTAFWRFASAPDVKLVDDAKGGRPRPRVSVSAALNSGTAAASPTKWSNKKAAQSTRTSSGRRESCLEPPPGRDRECLLVSYHR